MKNKAMVTTTYEDMRVLEMAKRATYVRGVFG